MGSSCPHPSLRHSEARNPTGLLIYDADGHVALAIMQSGRAKGDQPTLEEAIADLDGYRAGFGTFSVNEAESTVTTHVQGARDPRLTGTDRTSGVELVGDRLTVTRPASADGGQNTLVWERVPDLAAPTPTHQRVSAFWRHVPNEGAPADEPPVRPRLHHLHIRRTHDGSSRPTGPRDLRSCGANSRRGASGCEHVHKLFWSIQRQRRRALFRPPPRRPHA